MNLAFLLLKTHSWFLWIMSLILSRLTCSQNGNMWHCLKLHLILNFFLENPCQKCTENTRYLAMKDPENLNAWYLSLEIESVKFQISAAHPTLQDASPLEILNPSYKFALTESLPNITIALRLFLTLPIAVLHVSGASAILQCGTSIFLIWQSCSLNMIMLTLPIMTRWSMFFASTKAWRVKIQFFLLFSLSLLSFPFNITSHSDNT